MNCKKEKEDEPPSRRNDDETIEEMFYDIVFNESK